MQIILNENFKASLQAGTQLSATSRTVYNTLGERKRLATNYDINYLPWQVTTGTTYTASGERHPHFYASSDEEVTSETYTFTTVGSSSVIYSATSKGWIANITVTSTEDAIIRNLHYVQLVYVTNAVNIVLFAIKLDTPVELNAENNYTANFTFAIEF